MTKSLLILLTALLAGCQHKPQKANVRTIDSSGDGKAMCLVVDDLDGHWHQVPCKKK
jgi:hypothetical protein